MYVCIYICGVHIYIVDIMIQRWARHLKAHHDHHKNLIMPKTTTAALRNARTSSVPMASRTSAASRLVLSSLAAKLVTAATAPRA